MFDGFASPNYTMVPDELFDVVLPHLKRTELQVLLYIIRRTFGFKKDADAIAYSQFLHGIVTSDGRVLDQGCGISNPTHLSTALKLLIAKGLIVAVKPRNRDATIYRLRMRGEPLGTATTGTGSSRSGSTGTGRKSLPDPVDTRNSQTNRRGKEEYDVLWNRVKHELAARMSPGNFQIYIEDTRLTAYDGQQATIQVNDRATAEWLQSRFSNWILKAFHTLGHEPDRCHVVVGNGQY